MVEIGDPAPNVRLWKIDLDKVDKNFELHRAYTEGTTVLYFFPASFTDVCSDSNKQLRKELREYNNLGANVYGISVDLPFTHVQFAHKLKLNFPLLSDFNKRAIQEFGVWDDNFADHFEGVAQRSLFVIKDGKIAWKWVTKEGSEIYPPFHELKAYLMAN